MNAIQRKSLLMALVITLFLTGILIFYLQKKITDATPAMGQVVIATENIEAKSIINERQVKEEAVPKKFIATGTITGKEQVIGKMAREKIFTGEQIFQERLIQGREHDGLAAIIPQGYRAITINVDPVTNVGGNIKTGDYVDILVHLKPPYKEKEEVQTIFQNVEVLESEGKDSAQEVLTLCMSLEDAEKLFLYNELGKVRLVLRQVADNTIVEPLPEVSIALASVKQLTTEPVPAATTTPAQTITPAPTPTITPTPTPIETSIPAPAVKPIPAPTPSQPSSPQIPPEQWDPQGEIDSLKAHGLIYNSHKPGEPVTWEQFAAVLNRLIKIISKFNILSSN